jgi:hypothetical protein
MAVRSDTEGFTANRSGSGVSYGGNLLWRIGCAAREA